MVQLEKTILVIDDDLDFQLMVSIMLENVGFNVKYLVEGRLSLALHTARKCDMILDVELPGMNGIELSKQLKSDPEIEAYQSFWFQATAIVTHYFPNREQMHSSKNHSPFQRCF